MARAACQHSAAQPPHYSGKFLEAAAALAHAQAHHPPTALPGTPRADGCNETAGDSGAGGDGTFIPHQYVTPVAQLCAHCM